MSLIGSGDNPYLQAFNKQVGEIRDSIPNQPDQQFLKITDLYSRTITNILETSSENTDANQELESLGLLHQSYTTIQKDLGQLDKIKAVSSKILGQSKKPDPLGPEEEKLLANASSIVQRITLKDPYSALLFVDQLLELYKLINERVSDSQRECIEVKYVRFSIFNKIGWIFEQYGNAIDRFPPAFEYCLAIIKKLNEVGFDKIALGANNLLKAKLTELAIEELSTILQDEQSLNLGEKIKKLVDEFISKQQEIGQDSKAVTMIFKLCNEAIGRLQEINRNEEALQIRSTLNDTAKGMVEKLLLSRKEQMITDHAVALQTLEFCNLVVDELLQITALETAHLLQSLIASTMKEIAQMFISEKKEQIGQELKVTIRAHQLCMMAANMLMNAGLDQEALNFQDFAKKISFKEQETVANFINDNLGKMAQDSAIAVKAHELCDKTAQYFIEMGLVDKALEILSLAARTIPIPNPQTHPLYDLTTVFQQLQNRKLNPELGARVGGLDTGILKGGTLSVKERNIDNKMTTCLDFTVNPVRRGIMTDCIKGIQANPKRFNSSLPPGLCKGVIIHEKKEFVFKLAGDDKVFSEQPGLSLDTPAIEIEFEGLGKVVVGKDPNCLGLYNAISIEIEQNLNPGETVAKLNQIAALLGLGPIFQLQSEEDDMRMKIGQLFKAYYPAKSYALERTAAFYELPLDQLKAKMISEESGMKQIFKKYLEDSPELMVKEEIYPGEAIWTVADLKDQLREKGALGFIASLGGNYEGEEGIKHLKSIIINGMLSTLERFKANMAVEGWNSIRDVSWGSGGEVFSRMLTKENKDGFVMPEAKASCFVLLDLDIVNRVSYMSPKDICGSKKDEYYRGRENLMDLLDHNPDLHAMNNEHMSKKRVQPEKLRLLLDKSLKELLVEDLAKDGLIEEVDGTKYIKLENGSVPVDEMLLEKGKGLTPEMFSTR
jgi:hypothetical protein